MKNFISKINIDFEHLPIDNIVVGDDLAIIAHDAKNHKISHESIKIEKAMITVCTSGRGSVKINLAETKLRARCLSHCCRDNS